MNNLLTIILIGLTATLLFSTFFYFYFQNEYKEPKDCVHFVIDDSIKTADQVWNSYYTVSKIAPSPHCFEVSKG